MDRKKHISVVVSFYNEHDILETIYKQLIAVLERINYQFEIIFVNDGSTDNGLNILKRINKNDRRVKVISLSRNFSHQNAIMAGLDKARGDAVILIDCDLEDDPSYLKTFISYWEKGYAVVYGKRTTRKVNWIKKILFNMFHRLNYFLSEINLDHSGIFCLMDKKIVNYLKKLPEKNRYLPGLRQWVGFSQIGIDIGRNQRYDNRPRIKTSQLFKLAFDSFTSFSSVPLKISFIFGAIFSIMSFLAILIILYLKLFTGLAILGWASTLCVILLIGGIQLICTGLQGEYIARIFDEVKNRPEYIIDEVIGFEEK